MSQLAWLPAHLWMAVPGSLPIDKDFRFLDGIREGPVTGIYLPSVKADGFATGTYLPSSPAATLARYRKTSRSPILQCPTWSWCTHQGSGRWLDGLREDAAMITSTQTLVSDRAPFGAVLHATITIQAQILLPSAVNKICSWSDTYFYMDHSKEVLAECGIEPSLYMLLGAMRPDGQSNESTQTSQSDESTETSQSAESTEKRHSDESPKTIGLVLRACKESSQQCLLGKSMRIPHYQRIGIIKVSSWNYDICYLVLLA
ncbi:hypothetical protein LX32DRAFT_700168 [Colletotrichum zoysiae]|uniref:Uncharacterized protein n=1 Tax=Colletotrichum zoysiae TaxID=1216348 RepID=A0AAD9HWJ8_9PEZI|nr:hypothetical protein LX32DRAFT_700168 [Colletotrichum zoysiae]